jgi:peptidoglycan LD-endopeptidase LytH
MSQVRLVLFFIAICSVARGEMFILPTPNRALLERGPGEKYLVGTIGKPWTSGGFGCVRSEGYKMHEGLDIRCTQRDKKGEPADPIFASAAGTVAYISDKPGLSNYGRYIVLRHSIEGMDIVTVYAHLSAIAENLAVGNAVKQGQVIATMGRSTNTREGISKDRAHLHFEIDFILNDRYAAYHQQFLAGQRNDHGNWNGFNLAAVDPAAVLLAQAREGANFSLAKHLRERKEVCRVLVKDTQFPFLRRYPALVKSNPAAANPAAYEIALDFNGAPIELIPRSAAEAKGTTRFRLLSVNAEEFNRKHCCKLVTQRTGKWQLSVSGENRIRLLTF